MNGCGLYSLRMRVFFWPSCDCLNLILQLHDQIHPVSFAISLVCIRTFECSCSWLTSFGLYQIPNSVQHGWLTLSIKVDYLGCGLGGPNTVRFKWTILAAVGMD